MNQLRVNQGPNVADLLFDQNNHRSSSLFTDRDYENKDPLFVRRGDKNLWKHIFEHPIHETVTEIINQAGFGGLLNCGYHKVDHALITALVERWRPETHTFHLPVGEATVTLQDVNVLWGLPIEGEPLTGTDYQYNVDQHIARCENLLGFTPRNEHFSGSRIKVKCLQNELESGFPENPTMLQCTQRARLIILYLCSGTLFPDNSNNRVPLIFLNNLEDLSLSGTYSWGSAVLACLYRNLCKASHKDAKEISGPIYLLQLWALERFPDIAPSINSTFNYDQPIGFRWFTSLSNRRSPSHVLRAYRSQLQSLRKDRFIWTPYDAIINRLPPICRSGSECWSSDCVLICWEIVEPHQPSRVTRQFGILQQIPSRPPFNEDEHITLHSITRSGKAGRNWLHKHAYYVTQWRDRHESTIEGQHTNRPTVSPDYMNWYLSRTVIYITNPGYDDVNQQGFRNDGSAYQLLMDGMNRVYQSSSDYVGNNQDTQEHLHSINNTVTQLMGMVNEEHRFGFPSQLTTEQLNRNENQNVGRRRARRRSQPNLIDEEGTAQFQNLQQGEPSNSRNFETGGTSNYQQDDRNLSSNIGSPYIPTFEPQNSPNNYYADFGTQHQTQMDLMLTPDMGTPFGGDDMSQFNLFPHNQSPTDQPRYSNVTSVPFDLNVEENEDQDPGNNRRRPRRQIIPPWCGTGDGPRHRRH